MALKHQNLLIIQAGASGAFGDTEHVRLAECAASSGLYVLTVDPPQAMAILKEAATTRQGPAVIVIAPDVEHALPLAREIRPIWPLGHIVFVRLAEQIDRFRRDLSRAPMIGVHWSLVEAGDPAAGDPAAGDPAAGAPALSGIIAQAATDFQRRARLRTTLDRANVQIASSRKLDNTDHRRMVVAEHYLTSFLAQTRDAIVSLDADLQVLHWNAGAERLFGITVKEALGMPTHRLPFWSAAVGAALYRIRDGENALTEDVVCPLADGRKTVEISFSAVEDEAGRFIGVSLVIRDVSLRYRKLEEERAEHEAMTEMIDSERRRLIGLFDQAPGFMAVTRGPDHVFEMANQAYYQTVGRRRLIGKPVRDAFPELEGEAFFQLLDEVYATGKPYVGQAMPIALQRKAGAPKEQIYMDFVYQPVVEPDGSVSGILCQGNDVTAQKLTQDALVLHQTQLERLVAERTEALHKTEVALHQSQKLEAIGKLTGGIAHDFNNILQVIGSNLELLSMQLGGNTRALDRIGSAIGAVDRGAKLSSHLLAFARRQPLQPVPANLGRILRELDDLLRRALGEAIEIESIIAGGLWTAMVDRNQLENVILNLAINARDAMNGAGKLTIELGNAMLDDSYVAHHADIPAGQYVMLAISDTGSGMTPEVIERAFEPFFTTKREGEGTGLGLSMAYGFVKQSGGHIKIYSEPGSGTTIRIYLPREHQAEAPDTGVHSPPVIVGTETVLVVEDDPAVQTAAADMLAGLGYHVLKASDGESALTILRSGVHIDLLFTDVVMPGPVKSRDLARQAKELCPGIAVLFTSGYTQNAIVHGGRLDPGVELLSKPYRREDLARRIRQVLENNRFPADRS